MCGISGLIKKNNQPVEHGEITKINDLIQHRGPDGEGFYFGKNFAFGHRRLSIIDLSAHGAQPMTKYGLVITFNGEIYNYIEIKKELIDKGFAFISESDTEVILAAYKHWGSDCVSRFYGMWSFAIFDEVNQVIFCSRDRFGIKPFYYSESGSTFVFGSEIKQILSVKGRAVANTKILFEYFYAGIHQHSTETFYNEVFKLAAGHNLTYDLKKHRFTIQRYYALKFNQSVALLTEEEAITQFKQLAYKSVNMHLRSDVTVGTCLSGGLDSSFIASIASGIYHGTSSQKFRAITAKSLEAYSDETSYAKLIVERNNLTWSVIQPTTEDFKASLDDVIKVQEEPCGGPSLIMQYFVMKEAKKQGCIVMLDGQGGDELLLGYERYFSSYFSKYSFGERFRKYWEVKNNSRLSWRDTFFYDLYFSNPKVRKAVLLNRNSFLKPQYSHFLSTELLKNIAVSKDIQSLQRTEIEKYQLPMLLNYEDRNSMKHSIEARVPLLDHDLVEFSISLSLDMKIKNGWSKYILRKASEEIMPAEICWRKNKLGFNAPTGTWMQDKARFINDIRSSPFLNQFVNMSKINEGIGFNELWKLYNVSKWATAFSVDFQN